MCKIINKEYNPLVSVFIVTYNSSEYIAETLDSVKSQTYKNIELIVSDDKSPDSTVSIVKDWIEKNGSRFVRTELVEASRNTGTSGNYNRAVKACTGEWLKMLDGDDLLKPNCVSDFVKYVNLNKEAAIVFSNYDGLIARKGGWKVSERICSSKIIEFSKLSAVEQFKALLAGNFLISSTCFINARLLKDNPYDERYTLLEDVPMWQKLTMNGHHIDYMDVCTVYYRKADSVTSSTSTLFSKSFLSIRKRYFEEVELPYIIEYQLQSAYNTKMRYFTWYNWCVKFLDNKKNKLTTPLSLLFKVVIYKLIYFNLPNS